MNVNAVEDSVPGPSARPELLAPAGDRTCLLAAVKNGADAVYFGLDAGFNARARATNLALADLPELVGWLHEQGVRAYITLNTLVFPSELARFEQSVHAVASAGADAVLVQDLGAVRLVRAVCPDLAIHASTQMTLTSAQCIRQAQQLGVQRVVLARELAIEEIAQIRRDTSMPLEVFAHGALCVAYSGQCLTSESLGGRSANRGQCAQACRLPYELICDDRDVDTGAVQYLLSPQDLAAYELVPKLIEVGVAALKIEGRLKTPEYVANITRHYREAIDAAMAGHPVRWLPRQREEMELSFSRGFSPGWLEGCDHKRLVPGTSSAKRGVRVGRVEEVGKRSARVSLCGGVKRGDGLAFGEEGKQDDEQGGRVYEILLRGHSVTGMQSRGVVELTFGKAAIDWSRVRAGQIVWKTDDPELTRKLRRSFESASSTRRMPIDITVSAAPGEALHLTAQTESGTRLVLKSPSPLAAATRHPLTVEVLRSQFARLGGTPYRLRNLEASIAGEPMAPLSVLGALRHRLVEALENAPKTAPPRQVAVCSVLPKLKEEDRRLPPESASPAGRVQLHVLCRSLAQLRAVLSDGARSVMVDFQDIREYRQAVELAAGAGANILLATPRIQKPEEAGIFRVLQRHGASGILVRNLAGVAFCREEGLAWIADYSLNAANELTVGWLLRQGAQRVTVSYDLNRDQVNDLVAAAPADRLEVVVHQHMPMFHMEHCVFCAVLSPGTNKTNCGRPCDVHQVRLRDRIGMEHPLVADVGCRNTLFNAVPQSAAEAAPDLLARGVRHFRVELLHDEPPDAIAKVINLYRELLAGHCAAREVWSQLNAANRLGVTRGTLEERRNPLAIL